MKHEKKLEGKVPIMEHNLFHGGELRESHVKKMGNPFHKGNPHRTVSRGSVSTIGC